MATDAGSIVYTVDVNTGNLLNAEKKINKSTNTMASGFTKVGSAISAVAAGVGIGLLGKKLISVQRKFDKLNASMLTATGSLKDANQAMQALQQFAATTPFGIEQSVEAFTKLVNFGLTPSEEAMRSFGDTSSALGKDLVQMIEAVADAATGEFERLKEFGIKSKNQGDTIAFTFRGTTEVVKNSAEAIEGYLIDLGKNNFAGAMSNRMATLDGSISMLDDSFDNLFKTIGEMDSGVMVSVVTEAQNAIDNLTDSLQSGELVGYMNLVGASWSNSLGFIVDDIGKAVDIMGDLFGSVVTSGRSASQLLSDAFFQFPANIKAVIQLATVEIAAFVDKAAVYGKEIAKSLNPFNDYDRYDAQAAINDQFKIIDENVKSSTDSILKQRDKEISKTKEQEVALDDLIAKYQKERSEKLKLFDEAGGLGQFKVKSKDTDSSLQGSTATNKATTFARGQIKKGLSPEQQLEADLTQLLRDKELVNLETFEAAKTSIIKRQEDLRTKAREDAIKSEQERNNLILSSSSDLFGAMAGLLDSHADEQSGAYKTMFAISKAFAIAQATMNLSTAISQASTLPWPTNIPAMASAAASGASLVSSISGAQFSGGRQYGGPVTNGNNYRVNETGQAEIYSSGGKDYLMNSGNGKVTPMEEFNGGSGVTVNINNMASGVDVQATPSNDGKVIDIAVRTVMSQLNEQVASGNGAFMKNLKANTNVTTKASR